ncbi:MAG TPA: tyrosine-type recombinase/integrase, partial [Fimbriiglobus sp.]
LVVNQVLPTNPATCVRGPRHVVEMGKTPILDTDDARRLLDSFDTSHVVGLRDRALIGVMIYSFARVGAAVALNTEDYLLHGKRWHLVLHEKRGRVNRMPVHHKLAEFLDSYLEEAAIPSGKKEPIFRCTQGRTRRLTDRRMTTKDAWEMVRRRSSDAAIETKIGNHSFRATGITAYLSNGGTLEKAQQMAGHASAKTTKLYDRRQDLVTLDEVERILI